MHKTTLKFKHDKNKFNVVESCLHKYGEKVLASLE